MEMLPNLQIRSVVIMKSDRLFAELLRSFAAQLFTNASIVVTTSVEAAQEALAAGPVDLFITGVGSVLESDAMEMITEAAGPDSNVDRILVVTSRHEYRILSCLRALEVDGVFDSGREPPDRMKDALREVANGGRFWSPSINQQMQQNGTSWAHFRLLTSCEQLVLAVIGDGCDDTVAASELELSPATVATVRRELHRKLGVQHRGELVRVAAQNGFVRFTPSGVLRPGYASLLAAHRERKQKRLDSLKVTPKLRHPSRFRSPLRPTGGQ